MSDSDTPIDPAPKSSTSKMRKVGKFALYTSGGGLALFALLVSVVLVLVATDPGLDVVRRLGQSIGSSVLTGDLEIGAIRGSLLSELHIEDVRLTDDTGADAIRLKSARLAWKPSALMRGVVDVSAVELVEPWVSMVQTATAGLNLARLVPPSTDPPPPPDDSPLNLPKILLGALRIEGGDLSFTSDGSRLATVKRLALDASAAAEGAGAELELRSLSADVQEGLPLVLRARAAWQDPKISIDGLDLRVADGRVSVPRARLELPLGPLVARASVRAPAGLVHTLGGPTDLKADTKLELWAERDGGSEHWSATLDGSLGAAPISLTATAAEDLSDLLAQLRLRRLDPSALWNGLPKAKLDLDLQARGAPAAQQLDAALDAKGWLRPAPGQPKLDIQTLRLDAQWLQETAKVLLKGRVSDARLDLDAKLRELMSGTPRIRSSRIQLSAPKLERFLPGQVAGGADIDLRVAGAIDALTAKGTVGARRLRVPGGVRVGNVDAELDVSGLPAAPRGTVEAKVVKLDLPDRSVDGARLEARVETTGDRIEARIAHLGLASGTVRWSGSGEASFDPATGVDVPGFRLSSEAGSLEVVAKVPANGRPRARLRANGIDLGALPRELVPELAELRGRVDLEATLLRPGEVIRCGDDDLSGQVAACVQLDGFALEQQRPELGARIGAAIARQRAEVKVSAQGLADRLDVSAELPAPRDVLDGAGWSRALARRPLRSAAVDVRQLDLAAVQRFIGQKVEVEGKVDFGTELARSGDTAALRVDARELSFGAYTRATAAVRVDGQFDRGKLSLGGELEGKPVGSGTFSAEAKAPSNLFRFDDWGRLDETALQSFRADFEALRLTALDELELVPGMKGRADIHARVTPRAENIALEIDASGVEVPQLKGKVDGRVRAGLDPDQGHLDLGLSLDGRPVVTATASVPTNLAKLMRNPAGTADLPVQVDAEIFPLPLPKVLRIAGLEHDKVDGRIVGRITARGVAANPKADVRLAVEKFVVGDRKFDDLVVTASVADQKLLAALDFGARGAGGLELRAEGQLDDTGAPVGHATLQGDGLPLRFVSQLGLLPLGLDGNLFADARVELSDGEPRPDGWIEVRQMRVVFEQPMLQPLYGGKLRVDFAEDDIDLMVDAKSAEGSVDVDGKLSRTGDVSWSVATEAKLDRYPVNAGQYAEVNLMTKVDGSVDLVKGVNLNVVLQDGQVRLPPKSGRDLHPITSPAEVRFVNSIETSTSADERKKKSSAGLPVVVNISTKDAIIVKGDPVDAQIAVRIDSRTNVKRNPGVQGKIWIPEGRVKLTEWEYRVERADILLEGRNPPDPRLEVRLVHRFDAEGVDFYILVSGTASNPRVEFMSSPARYSKPELLQIFLGTRPSELGQTDDRSAESQAAGAAVGFIAGQLEKQLGGAVPLDTLKVDADEGGVSNLTLGKWITREIFLAYRQDFDPGEFENPYEAVVQWRFLPGWMVEAALGLVRNQVDVLWLNRFDDTGFPWVDSSTTAAP